MVDWLSTSLIRTPSSNHSGQLKNNKMLKSASCVENGPSMLEIGSFGGAWNIEHNGTTYMYMLIPALLMK